MVFAEQNSTGIRYGRAELSGGIDWVYGFEVDVSIIGEGSSEPGDRTDDTFKYECGLHIMSGANVRFHFAGDRVKLVDYYWEMD